MNPSIVDAMIFAYANQTHMGSSFSLAKEPVVFGSDIESLPVDVDLFRFVLRESEMIGSKHKGNAVRLLEMGSLE